jgi:putative hydrolase of the HAD superfamily
MAVDFVLFDLGNVLVEFSHEPIARGLARSATREPYGDPKAVAQYLFLGECAAENRFDEGKLSPEDFFEVLSREMGLSMPYPQFVGIWNGIFQERKGSEGLIRFLYGRVEMGLLSNTNALHFPHVLALFPWIRLVDHWYLSYQVGHRKPAPQIYRDVLDRTGRSAEAIVYLDDLESNLEPARTLGMQTARISGEVDLEAVLRGILPSLPWKERGGER